MPEVEPSPWAAPQEPRTPLQPESEVSDSDSLEDTIPLPAYRPERLIM